ncbi:MAG: BrnT family toxin [Magnetococcales bacterium]|nr:BrnT family toxin [Magnetococcales bacterium]
MSVVWDPDKRVENLRKHGIDFADAGELFADFTITVEDTRGYDEQRYQTTGVIGGRVVVVVHTEQLGVIRVISMRKATKYEREVYFSAF